MNRRKFISASAGALGVTGIAAMSPMLAQETVARREIFVGGRRATTVDVHAHAVIPGTMELVGESTPVFTDLLIIGPERIRSMDEQGVDIEVLSINPFWYGLGEDESRLVVEHQNQGLAEICAAYPDRLVALATVALQHPELAAEQLDTAVNVHGLHGVAVGGRVTDEEFAASKFDPFWEKAEQLGTPIFIHPQGVPGLARLQGNGFLTNVIGNPLETTIAISHLIFEGVLDRFPRLRIVAAHGGGYIASYPDRSDHGCKTFPSRCDRTLEKQPTTYLKQMYFDSLIFTREALQYLVNRYGAEHVMIGSDYPFPWVAEPVDHVLETPGLSDAERISILGGNALQVFGITA